MRELQLDQSDVNAAFSEILDLAAGCRFRDCSHSHEPGCAVQAALSLGALDHGRLKSYQKLRREEDRRRRR